MHKVAPDVLDYGTENKYDTAYILKAIETITISSFTAREFFTKLGKVIVFLAHMDNVGNKIFIKRIQAGYYLPEILVNLLVEEKLPEVFDNDRVSIKLKEKAMHRVSREVKMYVENMGETLYRMQNPNEQVPVLPATYYFPEDIKVPEFKSACVNKSDVVNIPDEEIIYYKENNDVYCLNIPQILNEIVSKKVPTNPYTKKPLEKAFVTRIRELYSIDLKKKDYDERGKSTSLKPSPSPIPSSPILAPGLLNMIVKNITDCEHELEGGKLREEDGKCSGLDGVISESEEIELFGEHIPSSDDDDDTLSPGIVQGDVCEYCKKKVDPKKCLKTKIDGENGFDTIYFCCFKCFEEQDYWPKKRSHKKRSHKRRKKKKSSSKKPTSV